LSILDLLKPSDPELVEKTLTRLNEQDRWNDVFSTKLIELLDKIDLIKSEIRDSLRKADERLRRAESVTQAESVLQEKAAEFGNASQRLELALRAEQRTTGLAEHAKKQMDEASAALGEARKLIVEAEAAEQRASRLAADAQQQSEKAAGALEGARQMAVEARSFAEDANRKLRSAQESESRATRFSLLAMRFAAVAVVLSWIAMGWIAWFIIHTIPVFWVATGLSFILPASAAFVLRRSRSDA
jgi:hypothetical protein